MKAEGDRMHPDLPALAEAYLANEDGAADVLADWFVERGANSIKQSPTQICETGLHAARVTRVASHVPMGPMRGFLERSLKAYDWSTVEQCEIRFGHPSQRKSPFLYDVVLPTSDQEGLRITCRLRRKVEFPYRQLSTAMEMRNWGEFALVAILYPIYYLLRDTGQLPDHLIATQPAELARELLIESRRELNSSIKQVG